MREEIEKLAQGDYKFGFHDDYVGVYNTGRGLSEAVIRDISAQKNEPEWMLRFRLKSLNHFESLPNPTWGGNLKNIDYNNTIYYVKPSERAERSWSDVPSEIKDTFNKLGIPEAEAKYLSGVATQYDSEVVYESMTKECREKGVIFCDTDSGLRDHPEIFKEHFAKLVPYTDNKLAALNSAAWSGGSFMYVPKGVKLDLPLQAYFRINTQDMGQFERTLIIVDEGADVHYIEGCTAPIYASDSLHAAVVEIFVKKDASCRYTTIQNWSNNVYNLVTKRASCDDNAHMEWIDGNLGSKLTMKYPSIILKGDNSKGSTISIALAGKNQHQDTGCKMIHLGKNTTSTIISKSISHSGGNVTYRGLVKHGANATGAKSNIECDTIIMDGDSKSDTIPFNVVQNDTSTVQHEAKVSKINEDQLFYLMSRGISELEATEIIIMGFIDKFAKELPMEYAVELNQLIKVEMEGSIG